MRYCVIYREDELSKEIEKELKNKIKLEYDEVSPDIVIAIGGDGTIIKAVHKYTDAHIFGIHTGHLGFFANYGIDDIDQLINDINNNTYKIEELNLISCECINHDGEVIKGNALNEITIISPPRTLILDVLIDDEYLERFRGTGLCISTPSGSTAYNKSLDGSVIDPRLSVIQLTEIAGINSNAYRTLSSSLVLSNERVIKLNSIQGIDVFLTIDNLSYNVKNFKSIKIVLNKDKSIKMGYHKHEGFIKRIARSFLVSQN